jgi:hypothetical protein
MNTDNGFIVIKPTGDVINVDLSDPKIVKNL